MITITHNDSASSDYSLCEFSIFSNISSLTLRQYQLDTACNSYLFLRVKVCKIKCVTWKNINENRLSIFYWAKSLLSTTIMNRWSRIRKKIKNRINSHFPYLELHKIQICSRTSIVEVLFIAILYVPVRIYWIFIEIVIFLWNLSELLHF